jgi:hypothetical protein
VENEFFSRRDVFPEFCGEISLLFDPAIRTVFPELPRINAAWQPALLRAAGILLGLRCCQNLDRFAVFRFSSFYTPWSGCTSSFLGHYFRGWCFMIAAVSLPQHWFTKPIQDVLSSCLYHSAKDGFKVWRRCGLEQLCRDVLMVRNVYKIDAALLD